MSAELSPWAVGVLLFLGASLLFYVLFAGADFGAGILELFPSRDRREEERQAISHAIAPVWEANHVWLILAVVILFMGFPSVYTTVSVYLHLPMLAVLVGIVARGCAFTFRHYDRPEGQYDRIYSNVFSLSSLWTSFFLGILAGAMMLGGIDPSAESFPALYVRPWLNPFCLTLGAFTSALFAFLASVYLVGEAETTSLKATFRRKTFAFALVSIVLGAAVFGLAELEGIPLIRAFFRQPVGLGAFLIATALWIPFWKALPKKGNPTLGRALGAAIVASVLLGWYAVQFPFAVRFSSSAGIRFAEAAAPKATLRVLLGALLAGSLLIFPALAYLMKVFKFNRAR